MYNSEASALTPYRDRAQLSSKLAFIYGLCLKLDLHNGIRDNNEPNVLQCL